MSIHTPGPWEGCDRDTCHLVYAKGYENPICRVESYSLRFGPGQSERAANARLIAAAPELLEALHQCVGALKALGAQDGYAAAEARAAIAKAEGR